MWVVAIARDLMPFFFFLPWTSLWKSCEASAWYNVPKFQTPRGKQVICISHIVEFRPDELLLSVLCQLLLNKAGGGGRQQLLFCCSKTRELCPKFKRQPRPSHALFVVLVLEHKLSPSKIGKSWQTVSKVRRDFTGAH